MQHICKQKMACPAPHAAHVCLLVALMPSSCPACRQHRGVLAWPVADANRKPEHHTHFHKEAKNEGTRRQASYELSGSLPVITI